MIGSFFNSDIYILGLALHLASKINVSEYFADCVEEIGIDYQLDTYDEGLHLNLSGATKLSKFFANILAREHGIPDHRADGELAAEYAEKLRLYDEFVKNG